MTSDPHPMACTLSPDDYAARLRQIAALTRDELIGCTRRGTVLDLRYNPEAATRVRAMVAKERECCAFLTFEMQESGEEIRLLITAPDQAGDAVPALFAPFTEGW